MYVLDTEDVMGSPVLLVDPTHPNLLAFSAMHGGRGVHALPNDQPPTDTSRDNALHQPHTTFESKNGGQDWSDYPYHSPDALNKAGREVFGEDNAATLDAQGRLYLAALYAYRDAPTTPFAAAPGVQYAVGVWKEHKLDAAPDYFANTKLLEPAQGDVVDSLHMLYVPAADTVALLWRESAPGKSFVQLHWTSPTSGALWNKVEDQSISGCDAISNPIAVGRSVYLACRAGKAWTTYGVDSATWKARKIDTATITTTHALLVKRGDAGNMVLVGSGLASDNSTAQVSIAYGEDGARWSSPDEFASKLTRATPAAPLADARVTAAAFAPVSGNLHLIYMERTDSSRTASPDADQPEFAKEFVSIQAEGQLQTVIDLQTGRLSRADFSPAYTGVGNGVFTDLHDSLVVVPTGNGQEREFVAYGDYGFVRYAEVTEENFLPPIAPLGAPPPAIPFASGQVAPLLIGAPAGLLSGAMVVRTLMARRKQAAEAPTQE
jgi:hypothetical protein